MLKFKTLTASVIAACAVLITTQAGAQSDTTPVPPTTEVAQTSPTSKPKPLRNGCEKIYSFKYHNAYARSVYKREKISRQARRKMKRLRTCQRSQRLERKAKRFEKDQYAQRKQRQAEDAITPYGQWAIPEYIVMCESGGRNLPPNSATASGYYQFINSTWRSVGGSTASAHLASKYEQDRMAARLWNGGAGAGHWDCA